MKTRKNIYFKVVALAAIAIAFAMPAKAQLSDNGYANIDWQFNAPLSNHFADKASGWGMNFEGGYWGTCKNLCFRLLFFAIKNLCSTFVLQSYSNVRESISKAIKLHTPFGVQRIF